MDRNTLRCCTALLAGVAILALAACSGSPLTSADTGVASATAPVNQAWTTPGAGGSYAARAAQSGALQPAPRAIGGDAVVTVPVAARSAVWSQAGTPPLPPPPDQSIPVVGGPVGAQGVIAPSTVCAPDPCAAPVATTTQFVTPERTYSGCWPPCNDGISQWHIRPVIGLAFSEGTDPFEECSYFGLDVGRTFCGCWGLDLYYRYNTGRFERQQPNGIAKDGGEWHHFGAKITFDRSFGQSSKFYAWGGVGAGYFTTDQYFTDDSGFEVFGEAGIGYNLSRNWRIRAGVNVHGMDTDVTRFLPADDGDSRWLWIIAPVLELEGSF